MRYRESEVSCSPLNPVGRGYLLCSDGQPSSTTTSPNGKDDDDDEDEVDDEEEEELGPEEERRAPIRPGTKCHLQCPHGYELHGEYELTCRADGTWDGPKHGECLSEFTNFSNSNSKLLINKYVENFGVFQDTASPGWTVRRTWWPSFHRAETRPSSRTSSRRRTSTGSGTCAPSLPGVPDSRRTSKRATTRSPSTRGIPCPRNKPVAPSRSQSRVSFSVLFFQKS